MARANKSNLSTSEIDPAKIGRGIEIWRGVEVRTGKIRDVSLNDRPENLASP
jgi:hypothetical protein